MKLKNIFAAFISILLLNQCIYAQKTDPNSFFPRSVGNIWEYYTFTYEETLGAIARAEIIRDSVGNDGFIYLFKGSMFDPVWGVDTSSAIVYYTPLRMNWQYYLLEADSGDTWWVDYEDASSGGPGIKALVKNKYPSVIFGKTTVIMEIEYYQLSWGDTVINERSFHKNTETLALGFGLIKNWYEEPSQFNKILRGCVIDGDTFGIITDIKEDIQLPGDFYLSQNYPNPFNPSTNIKYAISSGQNVNLVVYDILGNEVAVLVNKEMPAGEYEVHFNADNLPSGIYFYRITAGSFFNTRKMLLIK